MYFYFSHRIFTGWLAKPLYPHLADSPNRPPLHHPVSLPTVRFPDRMENLKLGCIETPLDLPTREIFNVDYRRQLVSTHFSDDMDLAAVHFVFSDQVFFANFQKLARQKHIHAHFVLALLFIIGLTLLLLLPCIFVVEVGSLLGLSDNGIHVGPVYLVGNQASNPFSRRIIDFLSHTCQSAWPIKPPSFFCQRASFLQKFEFKLLNSSLGNSGWKDNKSLEVWGDKYDIVLKYKKYIYSFQTFDNSKLLKSFEFGCSTNL